MWLTTSVQAIADRIVEDREQALGRRVGAAPHHIWDEPAAATTVTPVEEPEQPTLDEARVRPVEQEAGEGTGA